VRSAPWSTRPTRRSPRRSSAPSSRISCCKGMCARCLRRRITSTSFSTTARSFQTPMGSSPPATRTRRADGGLPPGRGDQGGAAGRDVQSDHREQPGGWLVPPQGAERSLTTPARRGIRPHRRRPTTTERAMALRDGGGRLENMAPRAGCVGAKRANGAIRTPRSIGAPDFGCSPAPSAVQLGGDAPRCPCAPERKQPARPAQAGRTPPIRQTQVARPATRRWFATRLTLSPKAQSCN
jgi:hypothetical protein